MRGRVAGALHLGQHIGGLVQLWDAERRGAGAGGQGCGVGERVLRAAGGEGAAHQGSGDAGGGDGGGAGQGRGGGGAEHCDVCLCGVCGVVGSCLELRFFQLSVVFV